MDNSTKDLGVHLNDIQALLGGDIVADPSKVPLWQYLSNIVSLLAASSPGGGGVTPSWVGDQISAHNSSSTAHSALFQDLQDALAQESANRQGGLEALNSEIGKSNVAISQKQAQIEELNSAIVAAAQQATLATNAIWGEPDKPGILNGPYGHGTAALRSDGFLLRLSRQVGLTVPDTNPVYLLAGFSIPESVVLASNVDPSAFSLVNGCLVFPAYDGYIDYTVDVRITGSMNAPAGTPREYWLYMARERDGSIAQTLGNVVISGNVLPAKATVFNTYTRTKSDPFIDGGVNIMFSNLTSYPMDISQVDVIVKGRLQ